MKTAIEVPLGVEAPEEHECFRLADWLIRTAADVNPATLTARASQDNVDDSSDGSPQDDALSIAPCVDSALQERHLQRTNDFFEAIQSRCSKLVTDFLYQKMKVSLKKALFSKLIPDQNLMLSGRKRIFWFNNNVCLFEMRWHPQ